MSTTTSWASGRVTMPRTACRVVCGLLLVITILLPTRALVSVDFPALGRPSSGNRTGSSPAHGRRPPGRTRPGWIVIDHRAGTVATFPRSGAAQRPGQRQPTGQRVRDVSPLGAVAPRVQTSPPGGKVATLPRRALSRADTVSRPSAGSPLLGPVAEVEAAALVVGALGQPPVRALFRVGGRAQRHGPARPRRRCRPPSTPVRLEAHGRRRCRAWVPGHRRPTGPPEWAADRAPPRRTRGRPRYWEPQRSGN